MTAGFFYLYAIMTISMWLTGARSILRKDYYLGLLMIAIPLLGWVTAGLRAYGWLT